MEQMMARLLAEIRTNREELEAGREHLKEDIMAKLDAYHERVMARMYSQLEKMKAAENVFEERLNKMDTTDFEAKPGKSDAVEERQNVHKEEAAMETIGVLMDQKWDQHLVVQPLRQPKKRTQGDGGSRNKLTSARRRMTGRAVPERREGRDYRGPTVKKRRWKGPECNNGIRNRGLKEKLRLGNKKTLSKRNVNETLRQTIELKVVKLGAGSSVRIRKNEC
jgi:hypothetical protein